ncbi:MAG: MinD/ParA family protein [Deltaproteobacteria bacterium]|nr:MinD/ParA family protein [Deltaproteobacteria bacterium]
MKHLASKRSSRVVALPRVFRGDGLQLVSITGGKGGVGKSSIAVNLAIGFAQLGGRVLLVDGDLGLANADQLLGVHAPSTLWDVVQGRIGLSDAVIETQWDISLLPTCSGRQEMADLSDASRVMLLDNIRALQKDFDFVVIDTAAGIGETTLGLARAGDIILAVATPDPTSVRDAFSAIKILSKEYGARRISLVANMVANHQEGLSLFKRLSGVTSRFLPLTLTLAGVVVRDPCLARSIVDRRPLLAAYPGSPASRQITNIAAHLVTLERDLGDLGDVPDSEGGNTP